MRRSVENFSGETILIFVRKGHILAKAKILLIKYTKNITLCQLTGESKAFLPFLLTLMLVVLM